MIHKLTKLLKLKPFLIYLQTLTPHISTANQLQIIQTVIIFLAVHNQLFYISCHKFANKISTYLVSLSSLQFTFSIQRILMYARQLGLFK